MKRRLLVTLGWLWAGIPLLVLCAAVSGVGGGALGAYLVFSADLPKIPDLKAYKPKTVSLFYAEDGSVIGSFFREKRFPIPLENMPPHVVNAFLAAEDARFFSHTGVDVFGVIRALVINFHTGSFTQGGSTITQQVTRNFLLTKEKKLSRKIREGILAVRLERNLPKHRILELYLNEIYLGKDAYGVQAAAETWFGKPLSKLSTAEAALLAGLTAGPSKFDPRKNLEGCLKRREFVLGAMLKHGFINEAEYAVAMEEAPVFSEITSLPQDRTPWFTEAVRRYILAKYGENKLYHDGLQVWTTCDPAMQSHAQDALLRGAASWERRQGRGPGLVKRLKPAEVKEFLDNEPDTQFKVGDFVQAVVVTNNATQPPAQKKKAKSEPETQECVLALPGGVRFEAKLTGAARFRPNDLLEFRIAHVEQGSIRLDHSPVPAVQGAVVTMENRTGYVRALVGGMDPRRSNFNRAAQALRQPGSAFKPILFAAALEWGNYSPSTVVMDDPIAVMMDDKGQEWVPMNADGGFLGPVTLRQALAQSRNIAAVKLIMDVGPRSVVEMASHFGIHSPMRKHLSLALGSSEVTPLELTAAYSVFPNLGVGTSPILVKRVTDRFGNVLEDNTVKPMDPAERMVMDEARGIYAPLPKNSDSAVQDDEGSDQTVSSKVTETADNPLERILVGASPAIVRPRVLSPDTAYLMLSMMRDVCVSGTAAQAASLKRPDITGKTGTTDDCTDAWFVGSNPELTTGVWLGHDAKISLGKSEHGGTAALPVWMDVMKDALKHKPVGVYPVPEGVLFMDDLREQGSGGSPLAAHPDFSPSPELKQIAPADAVYMSDSGQADGEYGSEVNPAAYASPGAGVRILSRAGETLGYGEYARDKNGKPVVYPFSPAPTGTQAAYPGYQAYPGYPQEAGVYGTVPEAPVRAQVGSQPGNPYFSPQQGYPAR